MASQRLAARQREASRHPGDIQHGAAVRRRVAHDDAGAAGDVVRSGRERQRATADLGHPGVAVHAGERDAAAGDFDGAEVRDAPRVAEAVARAGVDLEGGTGAGGAGNVADDVGGIAPDFQGIVGACTEVDGLRGTIRLDRPIVDDGHVTGKGAPDDSQGGAVALDGARCLVGDRGGEAAVAVGRIGAAEESDTRFGLPLDQAAVVHRGGGVDGLGGGEVGIYAIGRCLVDSRQGDAATDCARIARGDIAFDGACGRIDDGTAADRDALAGFRAGPGEGVDRPDRTGVGQVHHSVDINAIAVARGAVAGDGPVVDDRRLRLGTDAVDIDAGTVIALDGTAGFVGHGQGVILVVTAFRRIDFLATGDAVARAFNQGRAGAAVGVGQVLTGDGLGIDAVAAAGAADVVRRLDRAVIGQHPVQAKPDRIGFVRLEEAGGVIMERVGRGERRPVDGLGAAVAVIRGGEGAVVVEVDGTGSNGHLDDICILGLEEGSGVVGDLHVEIAHVVADGAAGARLVDRATVGQRDKRGGTAVQGDGDGASADGQRARTGDCAGLPTGKRLGRGGGGVDVESSGGGGPREEREGSREESRPGDGFIHGSVLSPLCVDWGAVR